MNADGPDWHDYRQQSSVQVIENRVQRSTHGPKKQDWDYIQIFAYLHESQVRGLHPTGSVAADKFQINVLA
jgi:hypothetical protein